MAIVALVHVDVVRGMSRGEELQPTEREARQIDPDVIERSRLDENLRRYDDREDIERSSRCQRDHRNRQLKEPLPNDRLNRVHVSESMYVGVRA